MHTLAARVAAMVLAAAAFVGMLVVSADGPPVRLTPSAPTSAVHDSTRG